MKEPVATHVFIRQAVPMHPHVTLCLHVSGSMALPGERGDPGAEAACSVGLLVSAGAQRPHGGAKFPGSILACSS